MSGGNVPYHLRSNKYADRSIFMELLSKVNSVHNISNFRYAGFGGPYLEEFKQVHSLFSLNDLTSIEYNEEVKKRQEFNKPIGCMKIESMTSGEFIESYVEGKNSIIWLDYAEPGMLREQITEYETLLSKLVEHDVIKITLNANPACLFDDRQLKEGQNLFSERLKSLEYHFGDHLPPDVKPDMMTRNPLAKIMFQALKHITDQAFPPVTSTTFKVLTSFAYSDSIHQMLTFTGIILKRDSVEEFVNNSGISQWEYYIADQDSPMIIELPELSIKERLAIDAMLPCDEANIIQQSLNFLLADNINKSRKKIESYMKYYRHYPQFFRVNV
ncbi:O-methyltransferase [Paenibacillus sp. SYP-B4298]|uniref:O-methyltransferase n=1 Tax=Paenibacillus sp. SYP-B4298 TaxID=2996034 RepID=UPI0022DE90F0|nr:O-methyltransferase [Paenibacillus sp. SYP-B4298]